MTEKLGRSLKDVTATIDGKKDVYKRQVNGSVIDLPLELNSSSEVSDFFIFLSLERIIFVSVPTSS